MPLTALGSIALIGSNSVQCNSSLSNHYRHVYVPCMAAAEILYRSDQRRDSSQLESL